MGSRPGCKPGGDRTVTQQRVRVWTVWRRFWRPDGPHPNPICVDGPMTNPLLPSACIKGSALSRPPKEGSGLGHPRNKGSGPGHPYSKGSSLDRPCNKGFGFEPSGCQKRLQTVQTRTLYASGPQRTFIACTANRTSRCHRPNSRSPGSIDGLRRTLVARASQARPSHADGRNPNPGHVRYAVM